MELLSDAIFALAASPEFKQDGLCFAARQSGLYRSSDHGAHWELAYQSLSLSAPLPTTTVAFSPDFAVDRTVFAGVQGGVLRSVDAGKTWQVAPLPNPPPLVSALSISPFYAEDGVAIVGSLEDGVFISRDRGRHWQASNFGLLDFNILAVEYSPMFAADDTVYLGCSSGMFCSRNGGRAWREIDFPIDLAPVISLAHSGVNGLFAGTQDTGIYFSQDQGRNWVETNVNTGAADSIIRISELEDVVVCLLALIEGSLYTSVGRGTTWSKYPLLHAEEIACLTRAGKDALLLGTESAIFQVALDMNGGEK